MGQDRRISGARGAFIIDGTSANINLNFETIIATEDTVISVCTGTDNEGAAIDFKVVHNWDSTIKTTHGPLTVPRGNRITAITLTSGELVCF